MHLHVKANNNSPTPSQQTALWKWSTLRSSRLCPYTVVYNTRPAACCLCDVMAAFNCTLCVIWRPTGRLFSRLLSTLPPLSLLLSHGSLPHFTKRSTSRHHLRNTIKMSYGHSIEKVGWSVHLDVAHNCVHAHTCTHRLQTCIELVHFCWKL